jgi:PIN domain nuclease of toxin-antitoxin system
VKVLLDTHALLWYLMADSQLSNDAKKLMLDVRNELWLSMASVWEIGIKVSIGKLSLPVPFGTLVSTNLKQANVQILDIRAAHVAEVIGFPFHHKDPFDRMLAAQCKVEQVTLVSGDAIFDQYGIQRLW